MTGDILFRGNRGSLPTKTHSDAQQVSVKPRAGYRLQLST